MTTLYPRRDALMAANAEARRTIEAMPPPETQFEAISRRLSPDVLDATMVPILEAMDLGMDGQAAAAVMANAFANTIASFAMSGSSGDRELAEIYAIQVLNGIIDRTKLTLSQPSDVEAFRTFSDASAESRQ